jgi:hypothetical protein
MTKNTIFSLIFTVVATAFGFAQTSGPIIEVNKEIHDYGMVEYAGNGICEFVVTNTGTEPLVITSAKASCGCTVPSYPKEPIAPGASAVITVKYDTKRPGSINKSIKITSNAVNATEKVIYIKGQVQQQPVDPSQTGSNGSPNNGGQPTPTTPSGTATGAALPGRG